MSRVAAEADLCAALQLAVERGELFMVYQPKIALATGALSGVEALMRWQSPAFGAVHPSIFIPVAERTGIIDTISEWGLAEAVSQWPTWVEQGISTNLAFNVSALTLRDLQFPDFVIDLCRRAGLPGERFTVEVTEGSQQHVGRLLDTITRFRIKGMQVELDDFGTGYSSLLQLRQLPYTGLKIDRSFVRDAAEDADSRLIVKTVIDLAHGLGLSVTAEGVEDRQTLLLLRDLGCDFTQGFLISPPLRSAELAPWVVGPGAEWRALLAPSIKTAELVH